MNKQTITAALNKPEVVFRVTVPDIARGECANRRQCVIAQALDRQFGLGGRGYIRVDANLIALTFDGHRYQYHPPRKAMAYLRRFDKIGELKGVQAAREAMQPAEFKCKLLDVKPIPESATAERKEQINHARRNRIAELKARGIYREPHRRYAGV